MPENEPLRISHTRNVQVPFTTSEVICNVHIGIKRNIL